MCINNNEFLNEEANRCLTCKNARCQNACPISTDIPRVIELFREEKFDEAGEILFENNPMSLVCSLICPFENQCMGSCIRGIKGEPVDFPKIENFLMEKYLRQNNLNIVDNNKDKKVAIIGAGPAGLTVAFILGKKGYNVTIFDEREKIGGMLRYGIPNFRLSKDNVDLLESKLMDIGVTFKGNTKFTENFNNIREEFDTLFIGTGTWLPKELNIKGIEKEKAIYAVDFLKNDINLGSNKTVVIVGAGNVAMDAARTALKQGNKAVIVYRRGIEDSPATKLEIREAMEDGVEFMTFNSPVEIVDNGILLDKTQYIEDENNNKKLVTIENSRFIYECDNVIIAVSQKSEFDLISLRNNGFNEDNGVFFAGDLLTGPQTVVRAAVGGKQAALDMEKYLMRKE